MWNAVVVLRLGQSARIKVEGGGAERANGGMFSRPPKSSYEFRACLSQGTLCISRGMCGSWGEMSFLSKSALVRTLQAVCKTDTGLKNDELLLMVT